VVRLEVVQQAALAAVGQDFLVDVGENVRRQHLDLESVCSGRRGGRRSVPLCSPRSR